MFKKKLFDGYEECSDGTFPEEEKGEEYGDLWGECTSA